MRIYKYSFAASLITFLILLSGCNNSNKEVIDMVHELDSLRAETRGQQSRLENINSMIGIINSTIDSIAVEDNLLFISSNREGPFNRDAALQDLERYELVIRHLQERIDSLKQGGLSSEMQSAGLGGIVENLKAQLEAKNAMIESLRSQITSKDIDINKLRTQVKNYQTQVATQATEIASLTTKTEKQGQALQTQDAMLNTGYLLIGTKKDLERKGVLKKGKLITNEIVKSKFGKVDIRVFREITFEAKKPKILTQMPSTSYTLSTSGDGHFILRILDPTSFWSVSNFLVIQTK